MNVNIEIFLMILKFSISKKEVRHKIIRFLFRTNNRLYNEISQKVKIFGFLIILLYQYFTVDPADTKQAIKILSPILVYLILLSLLFVIHLIVIFFIRRSGGNFIKCFDNHFILTEAGVLIRNKEFKTAEPEFENTILDELIQINIDIYWNTNWEISEINKKKYFSDFVERIKTLFL